MQKVSWPIGPMDGLMQAHLKKLAEYPPMQGSRSADVGMDTGSPVIGEYDAKMPSKFAGTLRKVEIKLACKEKAELQRQ